MNKKLLLSALLFGLVSFFKAEKAAASITGVSITGFDSVMSYCYLPNNASFMVYGSCSGTLTSTDSVDIYINYDDGSDTSYRIRATSSFYEFPYHTYTMPGTYNVVFRVTAPGGIADTSYNRPLTLTNDCGTVTGKLFIDGNANCTQETGELGVSYAPIMVVNNTTHDSTWGGWSNDTGYYTLSLLPGNYTIIPMAYLYHWSWYGWADSNLAPECPSTGAYTLVVTSGGSYTQNFAYECTPPAEVDMMANGWNRCLVSGDTTTLAIWAGNWSWWWGYTCDPLTSTVTLTLDPHLTYVGVTPGYPTPATISGGTITWNYTSTGTYFGFYTNVIVAVSPTTMIGDVLCNTVNATATSITDPDLTNNTSTFCGTVRSAYDPNMKEVAPQGSGAPGYIANGTKMSYQIHFQNTGNAPARNITIVDTLSANVDASTIHVLNATHPVQIYTEGRLVKFRFNDINLPDSGADYYGSMGSVTYAIGLKEALPAGTEIKNKAAIYFDYNPAIITNTTLNTIRIPTFAQQVANAGFKANVYPNPAANKVNAATEDKTEFSMVITDVLGRTVGASTSHNGQASVSTETLANGLYIVKLTNNNGKELTTKLTVQH